MQQLQESLTWCPSFGRIIDEKEEERVYEGGLAAAIGGSPQEISAVQPPRQEEEEDDDDDTDEYGSEDFEFTFVSSESSDAIDSITADEIFSNGRILPVYPVFGRDHRDTEEEEEEAVRLPFVKLLIEEEEEEEERHHLPSTSGSDDVEGVPSQNYCVWAPRSTPPSPDLRNKSRSTGGPSRRWRLRDLVVGRSHSDGKEKFVFLTPPPPSAAVEKQKKKGEAVPAGKKGKVGIRKVTTEMDMATAHRLFYVKGAAAAAGDRRRSFLPYRRDLFGFFAV